VLQIDGAFILALNVYSKFGSSNLVPGHLFAFSVLPIPSSVCAVMHIA